jgi:hypothetical protein
MGDEDVAKTEKCLAEEFLEMGEEWQNAIEALIATGSPNPEPLATLIRGGGPIPNSAREIFAELLAPGQPEYLYCRLKLKYTKTKVKHDALFKQWEAVALYKTLLRGGTSSKEAIGEVNKKFFYEERTLLRYVEKWDRLNSRLHFEGCKHSIF